MVGVVVVVDALEESLGESKTSDTSSKKEKDDTSDGDRGRVRRMIPLSVDTWVWLALAFGCGDRSPYHHHPIRELWLSTANFFKHGMHICWRARHVYRM
jgi:hypothetical protein